MLIAHRKMAVEPPARGFVRAEDSPSASDTVRLSFDRGAMEDHLACVPFAYLGARSPTRRLNLILSILAFPMDHAPREEVVIVGEPDITAERNHRASGPAIENREESPMELNPSLRSNPLGIGSRQRDDRSVDVVDRLIDLSSWMMVLGTVQFICGVADYVGRVWEGASHSPFSFALLVGLFLQNSPIALLAAAWPLAIALVLRRWQWPELLWASGVTFLVLSVGGALMAIVELSGSKPQGFTLGAFHLDRLFFRQPRPSGVISAALGTVQLLVELGIGLRAIHLALQCRRSPAADASTAALARRRRAVRLSLYASTVFLLLTIRLPVWSAYIELIDHSPIIRDFVLKTDIERIHSSGNRPTYLATWTPADQFQVQREQYLHTIQQHDRSPEPAPKNPAYRLNLALSLNNLAWLLATHPDANPEERPLAVTYAKRAVEIAPEDGNDWNTLGVSLYRAGSFDEARTALEQAMKLRNGGDSFDWFFMALIDVKSARKDQAKVWYEKAVQWYQQYRPLDIELQRFHVEAARALGLQAPDVRPAATPISIGRGGERVVPRGLPSPSNSSARTRRTWR